MALYGLHFLRRHGVSLMETLRTPLAVTPQKLSSFSRNTPITSYEVAKLSNSSAWKIVNGGDTVDYIMSIWTGGGDANKKCFYNLVCGHAYTLLETRNVIS